MVTLFVDNLWDTRAISQIVTNNICLTQTTCPTPLNPNTPAKLRELIGQPRTFGITVSKRF